MEADSLTSNSHGSQKSVSPIVATFPILRHFPLNHENMGERVDPLSPNWGSESKFPQLSTWDLILEMANLWDEPKMKFNKQPDLNPMATWPLMSCKLRFFFRCHLSLFRRSTDLSILSFYPSRFVLCPKCIPLKFCNWRSGIHFGRKKQVAFWGYYSFKTHLNWSPSTSACSLLRVCSVSRYLKCLTIQPQTGNKYCLNQFRWEVKSYTKSETKIPTHIDLAKL